MGGAWMFFRNNWKWIVLLIIAIFLILYIRRNWYKIKRVFQVRDITLEPGEPEEVPVDREPYLKGLASQIYEDIEDTSFFGHKTAVYKELNALSDTELLYVSKYYKRYISGGDTLYEDIEGENFLFVDDVSEYGIDTKVLTRLAKIGER